MSQGGVGRKGRKGRMGRKSGQEGQGRPNAPGPVVRYAVVGQGFFAQAAVLPAFAHAPNSRLVALVSDDKTKLRSLQRKYRVEHVLGYDDYNKFLRSKKVDAVYIALPNDLHADFAIRAAKRGIHVLCEKPMALTPRECRRMMRVAQRHGVRLMVGYRLHFEEANLLAVDVVRRRAIGEPRFFSSIFTMQVKPGNIRTQREHGGGPLWDIGIYCVNAARYIFQDEPESVVAQWTSGPDGRFDEVEEQVSAVLRFPNDRLATFTASFGAADISSYTVAGSKGSLTVEPAYEFAGTLRHELKVDGRTTRRTFPKRDQVAPELVHFSDCILGGKEPEPSGKEGLIDVEILHAIEKSCRTGRAVPINVPHRGRRPTLDQEMHEPPPRKRQLVHAQVPHA